MSLKGAWNALVGKTTGNEIVTTDNRKVEIIKQDDLFPVVKIPEMELKKYKKIPIAELAVLGGSFSQIPESARTMVSTTTRSITMKETLFVAFNPKNIAGYLTGNDYGTVGNIMQVNEQGRKVIAGRMRFKPVDTVSVQQINKTIMPFDPTMLVIGVAMISIQQKLNSIEAKIEEVLQFLKLEKKAKQRGNLSTLLDIAEEYRFQNNNVQVCNDRNVIVSQIRKEAMEDIIFYQDSVEKQLKKRKTLHLAKNAYADSVMSEFVEYQLACYIYAYCTYLDVLLRKDFSKGTLEYGVKKMQEASSKYHELFDECFRQIEHYHSGSIESHLIRGIGAATSGIGKVIGAVPIVKEGPVDEALIIAGDTLSKKNKNSVEGKMEEVKIFEDSHMEEFIQNLQRINIMYNQEYALLTDGDNVYALGTA